MDGDMRRGIGRYWEGKEERAQYPYTNSQSSQVYMGHMMSFFFTLSLHVLSFT